MKTYLDSRHRWPYPTITQASANGLWTEVSQAHYDEMLGVVPPQLYVPPGGFFVGENAGSDAQGRPIASLFVSLGRRRYFARNVRVTEADAATAVAELREAIKAETAVPQ